LRFASNTTAAVLVLLVVTPLAAYHEDRPYTPLSQLAETGAQPEIRSHASHEGQLPTIDTLRRLPAQCADPTTASGAGGTPLSLVVLGVFDIDRFALGSCQTETVRILVDYSPDKRTGRWALRTATFFDEPLPQSVSRSV
jgi:hypothetical protein